MPSRPKKKPSKKTKKLKQQQQLIIHHSLPTILIKLPKRFAEANSEVKFRSEEEEELACHQDQHQHHHQMADSSSNGNGKLEETEKVEEGEAVKDVTIDDYSLEEVKASREEPAEVVESGVVVEEEKEEEGVAIAIVENETSVVEEEEAKEENEEKEEEQYVTYVDETEGASSPVVEDEVEEMIKTELVSNGVEESSALPDLGEEIKDLASNGVEETEVPCEEEKEKEEVVTVVEDVVSKEFEEVALPVVEEISIGASSAADYKAETESANDEPVPVPVSVPVESADAAEGYGEREIPATEEKPVIFFAEVHTFVLCSSIIYPNIHMCADFSLSCP